MEAILDHVRRLTQALEKEKAETATLKEELVKLKEQIAHLEEQKMLLAMQASGR